VPVHLIGPLAGENTFSAGVNHAVSCGCREYPGVRFLLLFETDNLIENPDALNAAIALLKCRPDLAAAGFTVRKRDGAQCGFGCPFPTVTSFVLGPQLTYVLGLDRPKLEWSEDNGVAVCECDVVYTSPLLVRREAWEQSGGFDEKNFPFADCDIDWAWRLRKLGLKMAVIKTRGVVHDNRQNLSAWSASRALHFHAARLRLLKRHRGRSSAVLRPMLAMRHLAEVLAAAILAFRSRNERPRLQKRWLLLKRSFAGYR
jgi:GT2 family glycosyltransferase